MIPQISVSSAAAIPMYVAELLIPFFCCGIKLLGTSNVEYTTLNVDCNGLVAGNSVFNCRMRSSPAFSEKAVLSALSKKSEITEKRHEQEIMFVSVL